MFNDSFQTVWKLTANLKEKFNEHWLFPVQRFSQLSFTFKEERLRFRRGVQQILQFLSFPTSSIQSNSDSIKIVKIRLMHD